MIEMTLVLLMIWPFSISDPKKLDTFIHLNSNQHVCHLYDFLYTVTTLHIYALLWYKTTKTLANYWKVGKIDAFIMGSLLLLGLQILLHQGFKQASSLSKSCTCISYCKQLCLLSLI